MNKAEKFIEEHTNNHINTIQCYDGDCNPQVICKPWLTPDDAKSAVKIEKDELMEKVCRFLDGYAFIPTYVINELKKVMENE